MPEGTGRGRGRPKGLPVNGEFLRNKRPEMGLSRDKLAEHAKVDARTIQRCEGSRHGKVYRTSRATLEHLATVLEAEVEQLILSENEEFQHRLDKFFLAPVAPPETWVGRTDESKHLVTCLTHDPPRPCCVAGPAGIGKTALARFVAKNLATQFAHGVVWLRASNEGRSVDIVDAQQRMADALEFRLRLPYSDQVDKATYTRAFTDELWRYPRLVILDDVVDGELVSSLLPRNSPAALLVTTHLLHVAEHPDLDTLMLEGLSLDSTEQILVHHIGARRVERDPDGVAALHHVLGGVPRSIYIAARILQRNRLVEIGEYAEQIRKNPAAGEFPSTLSTAKNSLVISFSQIQAHVSEAAWSLLGALSLFGDAPFSLQWAAVAGLLESTDAVKVPLSELIDVYLVAETESAQQGSGAEHRRFVLGSHVPIFGRTILGDRRAAVFERVARHAVATAQHASAREDWSQIQMERRLWAHVLDTMVDFVFDVRVLREWDGYSPFPARMWLGFGNGYLADTVTLLLPYLQDEVLPQLGVWLRGAVASAQALKRTKDEGRLLLALGRFWLRAHVDMPKAIECFEAAANHFITVDAPALASTALSEAGRASLGSKLHQQGLDCFERALEYARAGYDSGPELACRINNAAASFTRQRGLEVWQRAADLFHDAVAACPGTDLASTMLRVVCTLNLATAQRVLADAGQASATAMDKKTIDRVASEWHALGLDTPLLEARILLVRAALFGDKDASLRARARSLWHEQLGENPPELAEQHVLWLIGEAAFHTNFYLRNRGAATSELPPNIARGIALSDVSREIRLPGGDFVPLGLLFPVALLVDVFDREFIAGAKEWADEVFGPDTRVSTELAELAQQAGQDQGADGRAGSDDRGGVADK